MDGALPALRSSGGIGLSLRFTWWRPKRPGTPILMYHEVGPHRTRPADMRALCHDHPILEQTQ